MMSKQKDSAIPLVAVLLATNEPTKYIKEQLESIKLQENVRTIIYWGDYGSSLSAKENVRKLLKGFEYREYEILNSGPAANFFFLLEQTVEDYVAFADQDDVWLPNKLTNQVNLLQNTPGIPSLAHSNSELLVGHRRLPKRSRCNNHDFFSLAITNCCQGCTIMINDAAKRKILSSLPAEVIWHDWWMGLVVSLTGHIYFGVNTEVLYRIHKNNAIGIPRGWKRIQNYLMRPSGLIAYQIEEAIIRFDNHNPLLKEEYAQLREMTSIERKRRLISNLKFLRAQSRNLDEVFLRIAWIIKRP
jgi:rhamnosyltransferase